MQIEVRLLIGLVASSLIGLLAYRRGSLTRSGALGAVIVGTTIFGFGGWAAGLTLIAFFVSSSALSHFKENNTRKQRAAEMFEKGGQRDLWQALANGGAAAVFAITWGLIRLRFDGDSTAIRPYYVELASFIGMIGALATVNADTWATELGVLNTQQPRLITTLRSVAPGTSGAISLLGILAALGGAAFISVFFSVLLYLQAQQEITPSLRADQFQDIRDMLQAVIRFLPVFTLGGLLGSLFDSFLGATVQAMYYSEARQKETEKPFERDGIPNRHLRGWRWMTNDWVNFISSLFGALASAGLALLIL